MVVRRQIVSRIPHAGMTATQWGMAIEKELLEIWIGSMSAPELQKFAAVWPRRDLVPVALYRKLDRIIIEQARITSWRMELSPLVQLRKSEWDHQDNGPRLHEQYGKACAAFARIWLR